MNNKVKIRLSINKISLAFRLFIHTDAYTYTKCCIIQCAPTIYLSFHILTFEYYVPFGIFTTIISRLNNVREL